MEGGCPRTAARLRHHDRGAIPGHCRQGRLTHPHGDSRFDGSRTHASFNLSGLTRIGDTDFRFYVYTPDTNRYMDFQNVQFNAPAVPEHSTFAITLAGLACGLAMFRRRKRA
jgi:hypothetical protein